MNWKLAAARVSAALALVGGVLGLYDFCVSHSWYNVTGQWTISNTIQSTSYRPYQGLALGYRVFLTQKGTDITGNGEKWSENSVELPSGAHTPITIAGSISGKKITATLALLTSSLRR